MSERNHTRIEDLMTAYELGLLDAADRKRVEDALLDDPQLMDELFDDAPLAEAMLADPSRLAAAGRAGLRAANPGLGERLAAFVSSFFQPRIAVPVATAAFVLALALIPGNDKALRGIADLSPLAYSSVDMRATAPAADSLFVVAMDAYLAEHWTVAADHLADALAAAGSDSWTRRDQALLYRGSALLQSGDAEAALGSLNRAAVSPLPPVSERARWQIAQAHLVRGDAAAARAALGELTGSPVYGVRVEALLADLDALGH